MARRPSPINNQGSLNGTVGVTLTPPPCTRRNSKKLIAFGWYGGKYSHLDWLLPLLPPAHHYCEPYAGSAAVLLNREPSPVETYNDLDGEVVNFFRVLREKKDELIEMLALTPFSREEFAIACAGEQTGLTDIERARRFFVCARQVRTGLAQKASLGRWANCKNTSRSGMSGVVSRWLGGIKGLGEIAERLARVQIENRPALEILELYDSPDTLFYCDPPYAHQCRGDTNAYGFEMLDCDHVALLSKAKALRGKVAISGYHCQLYDDILRDWRCIEADKKHCHSVKQPRQEVLWVNY